MNIIAGSITWHVYNHGLHLEEFLPASTVATSLVVENSGILDMVNDLETAVGNLKIELDRKHVSPAAAKALAEVMSKTRTIANA